VISCKVIFLDIDGVLATDDSDYIYFDKKCVEVLNSILEQVPAKIVVTSSWRLHFNLKGLRKMADRGGSYFLDENGDNKVSDEDDFYSSEEYFDLLKKADSPPYLDSSVIIGKTECLRKNPGLSETESWGRGYEIEQWLEYAKDKINVESYLVLDDDSFDLATHAHRMVVTDTPIGLVPSDVEKCLAILNTPIIN